MQKLSMRKLSILGLVLLAASAVTAAVLPGKSDKKDTKFAAGSITDDSASPDNGVDSSITCSVDTADPGGISDHSCNFSATATTGDFLENTSEEEAAQMSSTHIGADPNGDRGMGNTTDSD